MEHRGTHTKNSRIRGKITSFLLLVFVVFLGFWGCKSSKKVVLDDGSVLQISYADLIQDLNKNVGTFSNVYYPKVRYSVTYDGNSQQLSGSLSIKRGEEIFATVNAFLGIEVARVLMNKDSVIIKSNFERKLYIFKYNDMIRKFGLSGDFATIEDVLCYHVAMHKSNLYDYKEQNGTFIISPKEKIKQNVDYDHVVANYVDKNYKITDITYCSKVVNDCLNVSYNNFTAQKKYISPSFIQIANNNQDANIEMIMGKAVYNSSREHSLGKTNNFEIVRY